MNRPFGYWSILFLSRFGQQNHPTKMKLGAGKANEWFYQ